MNTDNPNRKPGRSYTAAELTEDEHEPSHTSKG